MKRRLALIALLCYPVLASCEPAKETAKPAEKPAATTEASPKVRFKTSKGDIVVELNPSKAPITVENFLNYVKKKQYDGTVFHRIISVFMIQGGGYTKDMVEKPTGKGIKNESNNGLTNDRGTIAMARTSDPNSATAQFFINVVDNAGLNYPSGGGYAVFGKVVEGMDVVDKIKAVPTGAQDIPKETVLIESASVE